MESTMNLRVGLANRYGQEMAFPGDPSFPNFLMSRSPAIPDTIRNSFQTAALRTFLFQLAVAFAAVAMVRSTFNLFQRLGELIHQPGGFEHLLAGSLISIILVKNLVMETSRFNPFRYILLAWRGTLGEATILKIQRFLDDKAPGIMMSHYEITFQFQDWRGRRWVEMISTNAEAAGIELDLSPGETLPLLFLPQNPKWNSLVDFCGLPQANLPSPPYALSPRRDFCLNTYFTAH